MKISVVTGVWKRPIVFEMFAESIKKIPFEVDVIVAGSEGHESKRMVERHGFTYIEVPNRPLGAKMNATTKAAKGSDYVICLGSDDLLSVDTWLRLYEEMQKGYDIIGLQDLYFYDLKTRKAIYWGGYIGKRYGHTTGVGRCLSKKVMSKLGWECWRSRIDRYLDASMSERLRNTGVDFNVKTINLKDSGLLAVDVKSSENITPFELWENTSYIDAKIIENEFSI